jgi:16S rRNA (guanine527-N7)-methyltransferase
MGVSRETEYRLGQYCALIRKWTPRINLIAPSTVDDIFERHIADCLQLVPLIPPFAASAVDLGSGAGLPGLVVAIALQGEGRPIRMTLIESDARKCVFLAEAARSIGVAVEICNQRILDCRPLSADVVMARALAPLKDLIAFQLHHGTPQGIGIYMKGVRHAEEIREARTAGLRFSVVTHPSQTQGAAILGVGLDDGRV